MWWPYYYSKNYLLVLSAVILFCCFFCSRPEKKSTKIIEKTKVEYEINTIRDTIEVYKTKLKTKTMLQRDTLTTVDTLYNQITIRDTLIFFQASQIEKLDTIILTQQDDIDSLLTAHKKDLRKTKIKSFSKGMAIGILVGAGATVGLIVF